MSEILSTYNLNFISTSTQNDGGVFKFCESNNNNEVLALFITTLYYEDIINEMIDEIDSALLGLPIENFSIDIIVVVLGQSTTVLWEHTEPNVKEEISTDDLKLLLLEWKSFLLKTL